MSQEDGLDGKATETAWVSEAGSHGTIRVGQTVQARLMVPQIWLLPADSIG